MLALQLGSRSFSPVTDTAEKTDRQVWGAAVRALRTRAGLSIYEAATNYEPEGYTPGDPDKGLSSQRWQQIEKGSLRFTPDQRERVARAVGQTVEELEHERARILGQRGRAPPRLVEVAEDGRRFTVPIYGRAQLGREGWEVSAATETEDSFDLRELLTPSIGALRVADDVMQGKADAGEIVIFDRARRPSADKGCVVETIDGRLIPRMFVGIDDEHVLVRTALSQAIQPYRRDLVRGVYAVKFWPG